MCLLGSFLCVSWLPAAEKPNIIYVMADDLGYGDLECYGQKHIRTPNIDRLAAEGIRFRQVYAGSTVCAPSRSVLMTGQHTGHTTVRANSGRTGGVRGLGGAKHRVPLRDEDVTVAEVLQQAGYVTGMTGKWGIGEPNTTGEPNRQGFDEWFGYLNQRRAHEYFPTFLWRNTKKFALPENENDKKRQYSHDMFTEFALEFIRNNKDRRFFLYLPWCIPHDKYQIPELGPYADKPWKKDEKVHAAMITRMDDDMGKIMALLKDLGIDDRTIVFFCSDNGAARRWGGRFDSSGPLRANKRSLYEGGIRTPMIVRWPGKVPAGRVSDAIWYFPDFLPTAADLAGVRPPAGIDGVSVLPTLTGCEQPLLADRSLYWESGARQAARRGKWKAVRAKPGAALELYDLEADPGERNNLAADHPQIVAEFKHFFATARNASPNWPSKLDTLHKHK